MNQPNWDKAPEGAEAYMPEGPEQHEGWCKKIDGEVFWWQVNRGLTQSWMWMGGRRDFPFGAIIKPSNIVIDPKLPRSGRHTATVATGMSVWTGTGRPPAGTHCEIEFQEGERTEVQITAVGRLSNLAWVPSTECEVYLPIDTVYHPIDPRAKEREAAAKELYAAVIPEGKWHKLSDNAKADFFRAIDAGWTKGDSK